MVHYAPGSWRAWRCPPGVTGWWQVNGRSNHPMHLSTDIRHSLPRRASFAFDLVILARTVGAVLRGTGAF